MISGPAGRAVSSYSTILHDETVPIPIEPRAHGLWFVLKGRTAAGGGIAMSAAMSSAPTTLTPSVTMTAIKNRYTKLSRLTLTPDDAAT